MGDLDTASSIQRVTPAESGTISVIDRLKLSGLFRFLECGMAPVKRYVIALRAASAGNEDASSVPL